MNRSFASTSFCVLFACSGPEELASTVSAGFSQGSAGGAIQAGDEFGRTLVTGNFDGDSYEDLIIGSPGEDSDAGAIFIMMGGPGGVSTGFAIKQDNAGGLNEAGDRFGASLAAGDFDNDGFDDLVVGAPGENTNAGVIYFWSGSNGGLVPANGTFFFANSFNCGAQQAGDEFGAALAAGDFNNDGFDDLAAGAPGENNDEGRVCVVKGRTVTGLANGGGAYYSQATVAVGAAVEPDDRFGAALAAGRFTSGAQIDLAIGSPGETYDGSKGGVAIVLFGTGAAGTSAASFFTQGVLLTQENCGAGTEAGDLFGAVITAGDITDDGYSDVIVGAPGENGTGMFFVFNGASTGPLAGEWYDQSTSVANAHSESGDEYASALAVGDFDADGRPDLVVGSPGEGANGGPADSGMIAEYYGALGGIDIGRYSTQEDVQGGSDSELGDRFGAAVAMGDFDNDGLDEIAIGAPGEAPGNSPAGGYVFVVNRTGGVRLTHGPILGAITSNSVKIWMRGNGATSYDVTRSFPPSNVHFVIPGGTLAGSNDYTGVVQLFGLSPDTEYEYTVRLGGAQVHAGTFRTLPSTLEPGQIRFAYGADINRAYRPYDAFDAVRAVDPQFMIIGGDNIYADSVPNAVSGYRQRYRETFGDPKMRAAMQEVPMFMMWDDHEITNDYYPGHPTRALRYAAARDAFDEWQASHNPAPVDAGELYYSFSAGEVDFFVLDTRTHRDDNDVDGNDASESMLGDTQLQALFDWLDLADGKFKFIVSSVPFNDFATTIGDAWKHFPAERNLILDHIHDNAIPGVVLLSGDQHWSAIYRLTALSPYVFYEFMPSPLGVGMRTPDTTSGSQILYVGAEIQGFGLFEIDTAASPATLHYSWISKDGDVLHEMTIDEDDIGI